MCKQVSFCWWLQNTAEVIQQYHQSNPLNKHKRTWSRVNTLIAHLLSFISQSLGCPLNIRQPPTPWDMPSMAPSSSVVAHQPSNTIGIPHLLVIPPHQSTTALTIYPTPCHYPCHIQKQHSRSPPLWMRALKVLLEVSSPSPTQLLKTSPWQANSGISTNPTLRQIMPSLWCKWLNLRNNSSVRPDWWKTKTKPLSEWLDHYHNWNSQLLTSHWQQNNALPNHVQYNQCNNTPS